MSGCNFFGKQKAESNNTPIGELADGSSIIGNWSYSTANTSVDRNPSLAYTTTYRFDPTGSVEVKLKDLHYGGIVCTAIGQYRRTSSQDITIYIQATTSGMCGFNSLMYLNNIQVSGSRLQFYDPIAKANYVYFSDRTQISPPTGVWDFKAAGADGAGEGGIDFLILDEQGYFIMQTTLSGSPYLLIGFYKVVGNSLGLYFFENSDPNNLTGSPIIFSEFITNGIQLQLTETASDGSHTTYLGDRL